MLYSHIHIHIYLMKKKTENLETERYILQIPGLENVISQPYIVLL